jgi:superfamily I DNA and/or RNA helicase
VGLMVPVGRLDADSFKPTLEPRRYRVLGINATSRLLGARGEWIERKGIVEPITSAHILIVAPYNSQVALLADRLGPRGVRVGTVDKFQGQQAPIVIYSMTTSAPEDAPRGMEFLYSLNRLNVATSRAQCACILVANPRLFAPECKTPRQMKLANALCRYVEMAQHLINPPGIRVNMLPGGPNV